jgi:F0F1-type ATP synthase beta subunit
MNEEEREQLAYVVMMVLKVSRGESLSLNEYQSLQNIVDSLGFDELDENYFRW